MQFDKQQIVNTLRERGDTARADRAQQQLPDKVDHEKDSGLLNEIGINPQDLVGGRF